MYLRTSPDLNQPLTATEPVTPVSSISAANPVQPEAPGEAVERHLLGSIAESSSTREKTEDSDHHDERLKKRYRLLKRASVLLPNERIAQCSWRVSPMHSHVVGRFVPGKSPDKNRAYLAHLLKCNKPFCPMCGFRRAEEVRHELSIALVQAEMVEHDDGAVGYFPVMITATLRHHAGDNVRSLREALGKAWDRTFSGRWYDELVAELQIVGKTKSWESTYGENGHHPHLHSLMFMGVELAGKWLDDFESRLKDRWIGQLAKLGLDASYANGLMVTTATSEIAAYIAKFGREPKSRSWGVEQEISHGAVKKAHRDGLTPLELLAAADGDEDCLRRLGEKLGVEAIAALMVKTGLDEREALMKRAGALFCEVYHAFERTAIITWGKNLREALKLDEALSEFEAKNPSEQEHIDMVLIERGDAWRAVLRMPDGPAELRAVLRTGDAFMLLKWLGEHGIAGEVPRAAMEYSSTGELPERSSEYDKLPAAGAGGTVMSSPRSDVDPAAKPAPAAVGADERSQKQPAACHALDSPQELPGFKRQPVFT